MENSKCKFCDSKPIYTCPKCFAKYCSSKCYNHSDHLKCTEEFYKEQVMLEIASSKPNVKAQQDMVDILKRSSSIEVQENTGSIKMNHEESKKELTWLDRFGKMNFDKVDGSVLWRKLNKEEQEEFCDLLHYPTQINKLVSVWQPWWVDVPNAKGPQPLTHLPILKDASLFPKLQNAAKFSKNVSFNVLNIVSSYVLVCHIYNGDHQELSADAAQTLLGLSGNLQKNEIYEDPFAAINSAYTALKKMDSTYNQLPLSEILNDVLDIVKGPYEEFSVIYIKAALSDLYQIMTVGKKANSIDSNQRQLFRKCEKKILFALSWVSEFGASMAELIPLILEMKGKVT